MKRLACVASVVVAVLVLAVSASSQESPTTKELMNKLHKGANAPLARLKTALKSQTPDWKTVKAASKELVDLGGILPKTEPSKGDRSHYQSLATAYHNDAKALDEAAKSEDKAKAQSALGKIGASCKDCHTVHKGK